MVVSSTIKLSTERSAKLTVNELFRNIERCVLKAKKFQGRRQASTDTFW